MDQKSEIKYLNVNLEKVTRKKFLGFDIDDNLLWEHQAGAVVQP